MTEDIGLSDSVHIRAAMMTGFPLPLDFTPSNDSEGMLEQSHPGDDTEDKLPPSNDDNGLGTDLARRLSRSVISVSDGVTSGGGGEKTRRPSVAFRQGEAETIRAVLDEVDRTAAAQMKHGFNEWNFTFGVVNSFFIFVVFGHFPQHFWILYFVETIIFIPLKLSYMIKARPLNEAFYYFDLCWCLNFFGMVSLVLYPLSSFFGVFEFFAAYRKQVYMACLGVACGPLLGAALALPFVAFIFHDVKTMTGLFIHFLPPFVAYTFHWHGDVMQKAWPHIFDLDYYRDVQFFPDTGPFFLPGMGLGTVAGNAAALYCVWFILYVSWMLIWGMDMPRRNRRKLDKNGKPLPAKYDTVFHSTVRGGLCITIGKLCWGRSKALSLKQMENNDFELRDFAVYMLAHATAALSTTYIQAYVCFVSKTAHLSILALLTVICVHRGSKRYTYYSTAMYGRRIRKTFENLLTLDGTKLD